MTAEGSSLHRTGLSLRAARKKGRMGLLWLLLAVGAVPMLLPFYWMVITSFKPAEEILHLPVTWWPAAPTLKHWLDAFRTANFGRYFLNSVFLSGTITAANLLTSAMAGYLFAKFKFPGREMLFVFVLSGIMIPFYVPLIPLYDLMVKFNWDNTYWAVIIPSLYTPLGIFLMRQFIHSIPDDLIDAARVDGASEFGIFFQIILPLCGPALAALGIFALTLNWNDFLWPFIALDSPKLWTLPVGLARLRGRFGTDYGLVMAAATITVLPLLAFFFSAQKRFIEGITLTGTKG
jgi:multiple sugar transport system permease protein